MPYMMLCEYRWDGDKYTRKGWSLGDWPDAIGYTQNINVDVRRADHMFYFIPRPSAIRKNVSIEWRLKFSGSQRRQYATYRNRETLELRLSGSFSETLREEFEYYLKQESKYWLLYDQVQTPDYDQEDYSPGETPRGVFVIIKSANFAGVEGAMFQKDLGDPTYGTDRERRIDYEIILVRVERSDLTWE